ncbi:MAG TPA: Rne/Rng family ribonuclease [Burkholderiaceae bacterium]|nr:Rne/Rng family ribonuclease [Burkholderiaceae bacterium]
MKRMLINATQPEERRLAIVDGQKLMDFETEIEGREQRKGNIYKAVVTRVEPSLEACFVDYGEERHGFLPFKEISKNYFREGVAVKDARIQDVIGNGTELLVQVEKEERGNKGAALTTFVSLAGRYLVLMPNNPRGGGVSRRIEGEDREELKENLDQLEYPKGMSLIARTAGIGRSAPELQWDLNYMLKLWSAIDGAAKAGKGAFLIYQESSLVIRAIRDYFTADIGEILIDTDDIYDQAKQFMTHVMPETAHKVKRYRDDAPLFSRFQIEHQIETAFSRTVNLPSGGAIVIDHTEALVSVDVNSARATRGSDIEETATRTNLEAADEIARQMRLRDLGGLIVVDFIDMDESKNRREVEMRLRDALRQDRARVQLSAISKFGLLELSRQRLRPALSEGSHITCPRCNGTGHIRDTESSALQILRMVQEESMKDNTAAVHVQVPVEVTSFLLNEKRTEITKIELKQRVTVLLVPNKNLETPNYRLERLRHDDPRLENLQASYTMIDELDEEVGITRREKAKAKQEPVIKGVLPETPAPVIVPKPEPVAPPPAPVQVVAPPPVAAPAGSGFFGWIKSLFGAPAEVRPATSQPATIDKPAPAEAPADKPGGGRRGGRNGDRDRGNRRHGEQRGEGRGERGEGRGERGARGGRRGDREERTDNAASAAAGDDNRAERTERGERGERGGRRDRGERAERGERGERGERDERNGRNAVNDRAERDVAAQGVAAAEIDTAATAFADTQPGIAAEGGEQRGERGRRRRRGGRGGRDRDAGAAQADSNEGQVGDTATAEAAASEGEVAEAVADNGSALAVAAADAESRASDLAVEAEANQGEAARGGGRRRGGRGRSRNEAREATTADAESDGQPTQAAVEAVAEPSIEQVPQAPQSFAAQSVEPAPGEAAQATVEQDVAAGEESTAESAAPAIARPERAAAADAPAQPATFKLDAEQLQAIAAAAGLQWVGSDAAKIAAAREAMEREPKPVHVPREPKPVEIVDVGPLVMVETRKDLSQIQLPFDTPAGGSQPHA